ncbi:MAG: HTTM domain-containing protein [Bradymonadia bacterium]
MSAPLDLQGRWQRYWFDHTVHPLRLNLLRLLVFGVLAFDVWMLNIEHAPRYGAGAFNATQFAWLDALIPTPGVVAVGLAWLLCGYMALQAALGVAVKASVIGACVLYNGVYYWSQADSYQHHYLLGLVLLLCVFMPFDDPETRRREDPAPIKSWAWMLLRWQMAITYFYTGVTKWDEVWWDGSVMQQLTPNCSPLIDHIATQGDLLGVTVAGSWTLAAVGVMVVELMAPLPFLLPRGGKLLIGVLPAAFVFMGWKVMGSQDWGALVAVGALIGGAAYATETIARGWLSLPVVPLAAWALFSGDDIAIQNTWLFVYAAGQCAVIIGLGRLKMVWLFGLLTLPMFHILVEFLNLEIGWFSAYMLALDFIMLTPPALWVFLQRQTARLAGIFDGLKSFIDTLAERKVDGATRWMYAITAAICAAALTLALPFEGMSWAAGAIFFAVLATLDGGPNLFERAVAPKAAMQVLMAGAMVLALNTSTVPFDYYRFWGGDLKRRGAEATDVIDSPEARRVILLDAADKYRKANALQAPATPARHYALGRVLDQLGEREEASAAYAEEVSVQKAALEKEYEAMRKAPNPEGLLELAKHYNSAAARMRRVTSRLGGEAQYAELVADATRLAGVWEVESRQTFEDLLEAEPQALQCMPGARRLARRLKR